ncbi:MAG: hypothetical protein IPN76_02650 [Saprospiraceae bacterium]|nr:hypothetical protein [Saprospiraceae bacterium]
MKTIIYGIFAEDEANKIFMRNALPQLVSHLGFDGVADFQHQSDFTAMATAKNGDYVFEKFITFISNGIKYFQLDLCLVGLDSDDDNHADKHGQMQKELEASGLENNGVIFIPVQAIEYWLWYIKVKTGDSSIETTPNIDATMERKELKTLVYGRKKPTNKVSNPIVETLSQNIDFHWLTTHSTSFKHFYDTFQNYLKENFGV